MQTMEDGRRIVGEEGVEDLALLLVVDWRSVNLMVSCCYCWGVLGGRSLDSMTAQGSSAYLALLYGRACVLRSKIGRP